MKICCFVEGSIPGEDKTEGRLSVSIGSITHNEHICSCESCEIAESDRKLGRKRVCARAPLAALAGKRPGREGKETRGEESNGEERRGE
jgi:hypothetical protein